MTCSTSACICWCCCVPPHSFFARVVRRREERAAWALIGAGVLAWSLGEVYYTLALWNLAEHPDPVGGRRRLPCLPAADLRGDLPVGASARAAAASGRCGRTAWRPHWQSAQCRPRSCSTRCCTHTTGHALAVITNLAYPVTDLVLLGSCVAVVALRGWRLDRTWTLIGIGVVAFWVADSLYLVKTALGTYTPGGVFDIGWWLGLVLIAIAAWQPAGARDRSRRPSHARLDDRAAGRFRDPGRRRAGLRIAATTSRSTPARSVSRWPRWPPLGCGS